jgi:subtilisin family serine protease
MARQQRRAKAATTKSRLPEIGKPIFTDEISNIIPGEAIVQLHPDMSAQITEAIPTGPSRGHSIPGPRSFGVSDLDRVLADLKTTSVTRITPPAPTMIATAESAVALASTFRVRYESETKVETVVERLSNVDGVEYAEPNRYRETYVIPNDPSFPNQWGLTKINCPAAWDRNTGSANVVVGVIDTGIDLDHPELAALLVPGWDMVDLGPNPTPPPGFHFEGDFMGRDNDPQDEVGHGTHVAGTIACASNNATGVAGVTWSCHLMPVKVLTRIVNNADPTDVRGVGSSADIAAGIRYAVDHGARVLNLSLGGTQDTQVERDAIAYAISKGAVVVAAMGNAFQSGNPTSFPAAYPDVVAVGAINQVDQRAPFSQTGPHIDVAAPGVGVLSTVWDNGYATMNGTSMASPHVAGVAALILSCNSNLTGAQAADIIRQTARPLRDNPADPVPNDNYGFGCVDAKAAIDRACPQIQPSRPILTCPSAVTIRCPSKLICPTQPVICQSRLICPSQPVICQSRLICPTQPVICQSRLICPSQPITCQSKLACPSGPICGKERPGVPSEAELYGAYGYDPYGSGAEDWAAYDPYAYWYGNEDDISNQG